MHGVVYPVSGTRCEPAAMGKGRPVSGPPRRFHPRAGRKRQGGLAVCAVLGKGGGRPPRRGGPTLDGEAKEGDSSMGKLKDGNRVGQATQPETTSRLSGTAHADGSQALRQRRRLPHDVPLWVSPEAVYFVTICAEPRGRNHLCNSVLARRLWETMEFRHKAGQWWIHLFLLMPDHLHTLVSFPPGAEMRRTVTAWKRYTARQFGVTWQRDFFDHRLRGDESMEEKIEYILANPVRAGLISREESWPLVWGFDPSGIPIRSCGGSQGYSR